MNNSYGEPEIEGSDLVHEALMYEQEPEPPARRQPHLGYALAFGAMALVLAPLMLGAIVGVGIAAGWLPKNALRHLMDFPRVTVFTNLGGTLAALFLAWGIFGWMWKRPFWQVLQWNADAVRGRVGKLFMTGLAASVAATAVEHFLTLPKEMPIDAFFHSRAAIWALTVYGVIVAPLFEETLFRGMLLPAVAMAIDWFRREPVDEDEVWRHGISRRAIAISAVVTSFAFAAMHAMQLGFAWNAVMVLWGVGLLLAWVRLHYDALAASVCVHAAYNGTLFAVMFFATNGFRNLDALTKH